MVGPRTPLVRKQVLGKGSEKRRLLEAAVGGHKQEGGSRAKGNPV